MVTEKTWEDFRETGLLWWINMILHTFGWAIVISIDDNENIVEVYPARVKFRGFDGKSNDDGYIKVTEYLNKESKILLDEIED